MAVILSQTPVDVVVVQANSIEVEALKLNAASQQLRPTIAGVWDLEPSTKAAPPADNVKFLPHKNPGEESIIDGGDERVPVKTEDIMTGGKYRSIVKLMIRYERKPESFAHGTGWLIRPDLMVTAGHNVFNWSQNAGRAIEVKAYIGYNGQSSINDPQYQVEFRTGKRVVTTDRWLSSRGAKAYDVSFIQVDQPFTNIMPIKYIETPPVGSFNLGVVGYPADIRSKSGERGAAMYEMFLDTNYNLATQADTMLAYAIDTEGGNSGGPVLRGADLVALGTHVYGGDINTASVVGRYGNNYEDHIAAMRLDLPRPGLNLLQVSPQSVLPSDGPTGPRAQDLTQLEAAHTGVLPAGATGIVNGKEVTNDVPSNGTTTLPEQIKPEGIFDLLRDVVGITSQAIPFLGDVAGIVSKAVPGLSPAIDSTIPAPDAVFNIFSPMIAQQLRLAQTMARPEVSLNTLTLETMSAISKRAQFADATLLALYQRAAKRPSSGEEGFWDDEIVARVKFGGFLLGKSWEATKFLASVPGQIYDGITQKDESIFDDVFGALKGAPMPLLPFGLAPVVLNRLQVPLQSYEAIVKEVSKILLDGFLLRQKGSAESALDSNVNGTSASKINETQFAEAYMQALRSRRQKGDKEELSFDDIDNVFNSAKDVFNKASSSISAGADIAAKEVRQHFDALGHDLTDAANKAKDTVSAVPGQIVGSIISRQAALEALKNATGILDIMRHAGSSADVIRDILKHNAESSFDKSENIFEDAEAAITTIARAFVLRTVLADELLNATMQQPTEKLKEEGFFDSVLDVVNGFADGFTHNSPGAQLGRDADFFFNGRR